MTVLIAINGSDDSDAACETLELLQWSDEDRAVVITVVPEHLFVRGRIDRGLVAPGYNETMEEGADAEQIVQACAARLKTLFHSVETRIHAGAPEVEILDAAREIEADLIVVGIHQRSMLAEWILGSVSRAVLQKSACSVLVARPGSASVSRIVVGYDGSQEADEALRWVAALALPATRVEVVSVAEPVPMVIPGELYLPGDSALSITLDAESRDSAEGLARTMEQRLKAEGVDAHATVRFGLAASEILDVIASEPTALALVGAHARHGWPDLFVGNTALKVAKDAPSSVLVVRSRSTANPWVEKSDDFREGTDEDALREPVDSLREGAEEPV